MSQIKPRLYPYPIDYTAESEVATDVLVLGGGIAGCWAAIAAAKKGLKATIVEKTCTIRGGAGGAGCDHWLYAITNPCCPLSPEEVTEALIENMDGYRDGISIYILCRDSYDCLLEFEKIGLKVRDTDDEFKGAPFRDEETKFLFAGDITNKFFIRFWGHDAKPLLYKECKRLGVEIYDRIMVTSLLTEDGKPGSRVIGATGVNTRTGGFYVFKGKAVVMCMSGPKRSMVFSQELAGLYAFVSPPSNVGTGFAIAWKAGATFANMESSMPVSGGFAFTTNQQGRPNHSWEPASMVDATGKEIPWADRDGRILKTVEERGRPAQGQKYFFSFAASRRPMPLTAKYPWAPPVSTLWEGIKKGEYTLPLYADLPGMPEDYRKVIWGLMMSQEGRTRIPNFAHYQQSGFDPEKDLMQYYGDLTGSAPPNWRELYEGAGPAIDWDSKTTLEGLYAVGGRWFSSAVVCGRWAGRHAADYVRTASAPVIDRNQVEEEKARVYAPVKRVGLKGAMDWREFNSGICRLMQLHCGDKKSEELLKIGLITLKEIEESEAQTVFAREPHELMHVLEAYDILTIDEMILHACLARKASCDPLGFHRIDYPEMDPPEWRKFLTIKLENGEVKHGEKPFYHWGDLQKNYEAHYSPET